MTLKPNKKYVHGPFAVPGRVITWEVCGHQHKSSHCVVCEHNGENGDWIDHVIKEEKKEKNESGDT